VTPLATTPADGFDLIELNNDIIPLAPSPLPTEYKTFTTVKDPLIPLAKAIDTGEVAGFITTGLILATLIAAVVGNSIRKMRTEETEDTEELDDLELQEQES
jgi:hypothetical protein